MSITNPTAKNFQKFYNGILPYLNGSAHSGFTPIGTVISVMGTTAPLNYLACDGTVYNIADYTELAAYFNAQFGSSNFFGGDGTTTFAVPDLRGEFLRGTGTNSHANQGSGAGVGVHQDGTIATPHTGKTGSVVSSYLENRTLNEDATVYTTLPRKAIPADNEYANGLGITSRPTNTSVLYCIASKNIFMDAGSNYSTEEQVVGTWIDGSTIYQKTIENTLSNLAVGSSKWIRIAERTDISLDRLIDIKSKIIFDGHSNDEYIVPYYATGSFAGVTDSNSAHASVATSNGGISILIKQNFYNATLSGKIISTIQYTKTTD